MVEDENQGAPQEELIPTPADAVDETVAPELSIPDETAEVVEEDDEEEESSEEETE